MTANAGQRKRAHQKSILARRRLKRSIQRKAGRQRSVLAVYQNKSAPCHIGVDFVHEPDQFSEFFVSPAGGGHNGKSIGPALFAHLCHDDASVILNIESSAGIPAGFGVDFEPSLHGSVDEGLIAVGVHPAACLRAPVLFSVKIPVGPNPEFSQIPDRNIGVSALVIERGNPGILHEFFHAG